MDGDGWTPLLWSAGGGHLQVVRYLIEEQHCNPKYVDKDGETPLHCSAAGGHLQVVRYLIEEQHCNPKCVDKDGWTPLHYGSAYGQVGVVKYLLVVHHCDPSSKTKDGSTPLDLAVGNPAVARELIKAGAKSTSKPPQPPVKSLLLAIPLLVRAR